MPFVGGNLVDGSGEAYSGRDHRGADLAGNVEEFGFLHRQQISAGMAVVLRPRIRAAR